MKMIYELRGLVQVMLVNYYMPIIIIALILMSCEAKQSDSEQAFSKTTYTCPMHPTVVQDGPGTCPICGMELVPVNRSEKNNQEIMLSDSQIKLANIRTEKITLKPVGQSLLVNARLAINEGLTEIISSRATGRIEKLMIKETGRYVRQGEPLYTLYSEELQTLQREYLLAREQTQQLGKQELRYESFLKAAKQKLLLFGLTSNQIDQLAKTQDLQPRVTFLSPASGVVTEINAVEGQYLNEGASLYRVEVISKLWVEAELYPNEINRMKIGDKIQVVVSGFEQSPITAIVNFLSPEYQTASQITIMRASLDNRDLRFQPGMQAQVKLMVATKQALSVPTDAVIHDRYGAHLYIETDHNTFKARMVKTGVEDFNQVEIVEGLKEGERVAVSGAYLLYSEFILKKGVNPMEGHHH